MLNEMAEVKARKLSHRGARQKGKRGEYAVRDALVKIGIDAKRVPMSGALSWMKGDVVELNIPQGLRHCHEVKNCERLELPDWWRQTSVQAFAGETPVLHFQSNYRKMHTMMEASAFDTLVEAYEAVRPELTLNWIKFPARKNFWTYMDVHTTGAYDAYHYELAGAEYVIVSFDFYLMLRQHEAVPNIIR